MRKGRIIWNLRNVGLSPQLVCQRTTGITARPRDQCGVLKRPERSKKGLCAEFEMKP